MVGLRVRVKVPRLLLQVTRKTHYIHQRKATEISLRYQTYKNSQIKRFFYYSENINHSNGPFSDLWQFPTTKSPLKMMKSAFYFMLKAFFVLNIFIFLSWFYWLYWKRLKDAVMQIEKAMTNDHLRVSKESLKICVPTLYNFAVI